MRLNPPSIVDDRPVASFSQPLNQQLIYWLSNRSSWSQYNELLLGKSPRQPGPSNDNDGVEDLVTAHHRSSYQGSTSQYSKNIVSKGFLSTARHQQL
jgi:hypothetical protein